jgi:hypothetical protein
VGAKKERPYLLEVVTLFESAAGGCDSHHGRAIQDEYCLGMGQVVKEHLADDAALGVRHLVRRMTYEVDVDVTPFEEQPRLTVSWICIKNGKPTKRRPARRVEWFRAHLQL